MFDFIRNNNKAIQIVLFIFVIPSFFLFGIEGYSRFNDKGEVVAKVDGQKITQTEWDAALKEEVDRRRAANPAADLKSLDAPAFKYAVLERLVNQRMMLAAASHYSLNVSDQRLAKELLAAPALANLKGPDGKFDVARYKDFAAAQGLTPEGLEEKVRRDLSAQQVTAGLAQSEIVGSAVADLALKAFFEKREIQVLSFKPAEFMAQIQLQEADIEAEYKANTQQYRTTESADVEYLVLDLDAVKKGINPTEAELKAHYQANAVRLAGQEERKISHILIASAKSAAAAERQAAKKKAEELLAILKKTPAQFASLAKSNSQDPGSAENGGDLGFVSRGAMVKPFEDAAFAMKKGGISDVVETDFGYHILSLVDIKSPEQKTFESLKPEIEADVKKELAQKKYSEVAESFTNMVYEQAEGLKLIADKLGLELKTFNGLTRSGSPIPKTLFANSKLVDAVFASDSVEKKRNTQAIETAANQLVSARIVRYTPAATQALDAVKDRVRAQLMASKSTALAKSEGQKQLTALKANSNEVPAKLEASIIVSRDAPGAQSKEVLEAVMKAQSKSLPAWVGVDLASQGYSVVKVNKVIEAEIKDPQQQRQQYAQVWLGGESQAFLNHLKSQLKVDIKVKKPL